MVRSRKLQETSEQGRRRNNGAPGGSPRGNAQAAFGLRKRPRRATHHVQGVHAVWRCAVQQRQARLMNPVAHTHRLV